MLQTTGPAFRFDTTEEALFALSKLLIHQQATQVLQLAMLSKLVGRAEGVDSSTVLHMMEGQFPREVHVATAAFTQAVEEWRVLTQADAYARLTTWATRPTAAQLVRLHALCTAAGRGPEELVAALHDAQYGQYMRLRDFGITAAVERDRVTFTYAGVTTTLDEAEPAVSAYLFSLTPVVTAAAPQA